jgi:hypothetical protein
VSRIALAALATGLLVGAGCASDGGSRRGSEYDRERAEAREEVEDERDEAREELEEADEEVQEGLEKAREELREIFR